MISKDTNKSISTPVEAAANVQDCVTAESWAETQASFTARAFNLLGISSTPPNPRSLICLSSTLIQLEASCFSQSSQQQTYGFSFLRSLWGIHGALCTAVIPTPVLSTAPSCCERYLWSFLNFLWGLTPLFWQQSHTLKISSITAVLPDSVYNLHRCFSLEQLSLNNTMQPVWMYLKKTGISTSMIWRLFFPSRFLGYSFFFFQSESSVPQAKESVFFM